MKTFEDALSSIIVHGNSLPDQAIVSRIEDTMDRYIALAAEVRDNQTIVILIEIMAHRCIEHGHSLHDALFTMFMHGLTTGIEMEKQCIPEI